MINPENVDSPEEKSVECSVIFEKSVHSEKKRTKDKKNSPQDTQICALNQLASSQEKLMKSIELMESSLAQTGTPNFRLFWEARKVCLEFFKDPSLLNIKTIYWPKYHELTKEALRLKALLEEQTAFAVEQIEGAIFALEKEIEDIPAQLARMPSSEFPKNSKTIQRHHNFYVEIQKELVLLNAYSTRVTSLRKELMKTEMRIRQKNLFFQRLSTIGDKVFPRRKELMKNMSQLFIDDVEAFVEKNFSSSRMEGPLHECREEIKALQSIAKILNLNTYAFTHTRMKLSDCWDKLKVMEQELKSLRHQKKESHLKNAESVAEKIKALNEAIQKHELSISDAQRQHREIVQFMRTIELGREEIKILREQLDAAQKSIQDQIKLDEKKRRELSQEKARKRLEKATGIQTQMETVQSEVNIYSVSELKEQLELLSKNAEDSSLSEEEQNEFSDKLETLKDAIATKEIEEVLKLPKEQNDVIDQLEQVFKQRLQRRSEIKQKIEKFRKITGSSGLDIKQSMYYNERSIAEKERLEKINRQIEKIENAISDFNE
jgi:hypothetical protein